MAEIEIGAARCQCMNRCIAEEPTLERELLAWAARHHAQQCGTDWQFTTADARIKLKRFYPSALLE